MAETNKPTFGARLMAFLKGEGLDVDAAVAETAAPTPPTTTTATTPEVAPAAPVTTAPNEAIVAMFAEAACKDVEPAQRGAIEKLARAALAADGGTPGEACAALVGVASAMSGVTAAMKTPSVAFGQPDQNDKQQTNAAKVAAINAGAVNQYNRRNR